MTTHVQFEQPAVAEVGDAWVAPDDTFKRVLSRGHAWENCNLGSKHPDEVNHGEQQPGPETIGDTTEVPSGSAPVAPGDGDDGEDAGSAGQRAEDEGVIEVTAEDEGEEPGVDANGSPVL